MFKETLDKLSISSKEAVVDGNKNNFDEFKEYLHINRYVQNKLEKIVFSAIESPLSQLILISGNVGDGKSHMMSRLHKKFPEEMANVKFRNDATESNSIEKSWIDELNEFLAPFNDERLHLKSEKTTRIVAINLGILSSFLEHSDNFKMLAEFVKQKGIIDSLSFNNDYILGSNFQFINLADYNLFTLKENKASSQLIAELLKRITVKNDKNPFYNAFCNYYLDHPNQNGCAMRQNFLELGRDSVQKALIELIMYVIITFKLIISVRDLLNFIFDIIVPFDLQNFSSEKIKNLKNNFLLKPEDFIYNKLFDSEGRSELLTSLKKLDPNKFRSKHLDNLIFRLSSAEHPLEIFDEHLLTSNEYWMNPRNNEVLIKTFIRSSYLNEIDTFDTELAPYRSFTKYLYYYYRNQKLGLKPLYKEILKAIYSWNGNSKNEDEINVTIGKQQLQYNITQKIKVTPAMQMVKNGTDSDEIHEFGNLIGIGVIVADKEVSFSLDINLYILLGKVIRGYKPNKLDRENHTDFQKIVDTITTLSSQEKSISFERIDGSNKQVFQFTYDPVFGYEFLKK